jgi:hypothetical protein
VCPVLTSVFDAVDDFGTHDMEAATSVGLLRSRSFGSMALALAARFLSGRRLKRCGLPPFFEGLTPCLLGIEACASAHHWSRQLQALGYTVRLMPPATFLFDLNQIQSSRLQLS